LDHALTLFGIESERLKLPAPFGRRITNPLDADAAGQATFYGRRCLRPSLLDKSPLCFRLNESPRVGGIVKRLLRVFLCESFERKIIDGASHSVGNIGKNTLSGSPEEVIRAPRN
jgi:hypothetical protein